MVYVLDHNGQPLMPTKRYGKVRRMLKSGKAKLVKGCPFTIKLMYENTTHTQSVEVGDDTGYKHNGLSAVAVYPNGKETEVYKSELLLRTDIVELMSTRRECRRTRRNRKTRYREPRFERLACCIGTEQSRQSVDGVNVHLFDPSGNESDHRNGIIRFTETQSRLAGA